MKAFVMPFRQFYLVLISAAMFATGPVGRAQQVDSTSDRLDEAPQPIVIAPAGELQGMNQGALRVFKGIPYAVPPVGSRRWAPPSPLPPWKDVKRATDSGPECFQPSPQLSQIYARSPMPMSEDCLTLNIWAPKPARNAPVFVWIHGGSLLTGFSGDPMYDGTRIANRGLVVVTVNYRLGIFGWFAHPELSKESPLGISGNYGLLDQIAALKWIKRNISAFGGDPNNVTIAGESSGALNVMSLMASPLARGLFSRAIAESAYMITMPELKEARYGTPAAEDSGVALAAALHASHIPEMRAMEPDALVKTAAAAGYSAWEAIDGHILPHQLVESFDRGEQAPVPLLAGFNSGEIRSLRILAPPPPATPAAYEFVIRSQYRDLADEFLKLYPSTNLPESVLATTRDAFYGWTALRLVKKQSALKIPSFLYFWDHGYPEAEAASLHAFHASEIPFVFGTFRSTPQYWPKIPDNEQERKLSDAMVDYWSSFAGTGEPTANGQPSWPKYDSSGAYMTFTASPQPSNHLLPGMYELDEQVVCRRRIVGDQAWNWNVGIVSPLLPDKPLGCR